MDLLQKKIMLAVVVGSGSESDSDSSCEDDSSSNGGSDHESNEDGEEEVPRDVEERGNGSDAGRLEGGDNDGTEDHTSSQQKLPSTIPLHLDSHGN